MFFEGCGAEGGSVCGGIRQQCGRSLSNNFVQPVKVNLKK